MARRGIRVDVSVLVPGTVALDAARPQGSPLPVLLATYLEAVAAHKAHKTFLNYRRTKELATEPGALGDFPTSGEVTTWLGRLARAGFSDGSVWLQRTHLAAVYSYANKSGLATSNPAALAMVPRGARPPPRAISGLVGATATDPEGLWSRLVEAASATGVERAADFLYLLRYAGPRLGEALAVQPGDAYRDGSAAMVLRVERQRDRSGFDPGPTKTGRPRELECHPRLGERLFAVCRAPLARVWVGHGGQRELICPFVFPYRAAELVKLLAALRSVDPVSFPDGQAWHAFRHTFAVETVRGGGPDNLPPVPVDALSEMLGHVDLKHTTGYLRALGVRARKGVWTR